MKCDDDEVDSLDVFNQEDVFLDSLEPNTLREKFENLVGSIDLLTALQNFLVCPLVLLFS